jgi:hypothetical protein
VTQITTEKCEEQKAIPIDFFKELYQSFTVYLLLDSNYFLYFLSKINVSLGYGINIKGF